MQSCDSIELSPKTGWLHNKPIKKQLVDHQVEVAEWLKCWFLDLQAAGSNPGGAT